MSSGSPMASRYRMFDEVAAGGMAVVHLGLQAGDSGFSRVVAIKRLLPDLSREGDFANMFIDEARLAARIRHPNVVHILDVVHDEKQLLLVMEYIPGESLGGMLAAAIRGNHQVPAEIASSIMVGALHGLHAAHEARDERQTPLQIVHRDVSPQNILVGEDGIPRVIDFGVAKAVGRLTTTRDGRVKGKAGYMAPEQLRGQKIDRRVDVYAAGVVLWELLVKRRLFVGDSPAATMMLVLETGVEPPSAHGADVPVELDEVVLKATQKNPDARYATAEEMAFALEAAVRPASAAVVATWARSVAGQVFAKRRAMVERVERGEGAATSIASSPNPIPETERTHGATVASAPHADRQRSRWPVVTLFVPILGVAGWYYLTHRAPTAPLPTSVAASTSDTIASPASSPSAVPSVTTSAATSAAPSQVASVTPTAHRPTTTARPTASTAKPDCDPPYVIDSKGIRVPKKECL